jgi:hypothetical protein
VRAARDPFRQSKFAHRPVGDPGRVEHQAVGRIGVHVGDQRDQIPVILRRTSDPRRHGRFAAVHAVAEREPLFCSGDEVVSDHAVEQEPAGFTGRGIGVAIPRTRVSAVDHAEFGDAVRQLLLAGLPGGQVEPPPVQPGLQAVEGQIAKCLLVLVAGADRSGVALEEPVEHDLLAVLVGVGEVQHECRVGLEPADVGGATAAGNDGEPRRHVTVKPRHVDAGLQQFGVPEQRKVVEDHVVLGEGHVVR